MTLKRIAELSGYSVATVSKAFAWKKDISEETREAIFEIAKKYGCFDKYNKKRYEKKVIAVICPEIISDYYTGIVHILEDLIEAQGALMVLSCHNFSEKRTDELFSYYSANDRADGIVLIDSVLRLQKPSMVPAVIIRGGAEDSMVDIVEIDSMEAIQEAIARLKELGHTEIGFAGEGLTYGSRRAYRAAMENLGLELKPENIKTSNRRFEEAGMQMMVEWLRQGNYPTAILAAYDHIAIGIIKCLKYHRMQVPQDISVVGINDIGIVSYLEPSLSTIRTYSEDACKAAVELLMKKMENPYYIRSERIVFKAKFIERDSTGPRKGTEQ